MLTIRTYTFRSCLRLADLSTVDSYLGAEDVPNVVYAVVGIGPKLTERNGVKVYRKTMRLLTIES